MKGGSVAKEKKQASPFMRADEVSRLRYATLHSGGKPRVESGLTKKSSESAEPGLG